MGPKALAENLLEYLVGPDSWWLGLRKLDAAWDLVIGVREKDESIQRL
jgi:hypothetical protein